MNGGRWVTGILGLWLALAGVIGFTPTFTLWDKLIVGIVVAIVGFSFARASVNRQRPRTCIGARHVATSS
ncbi:MAG TPA: SPW repeat protein [Gemmatimonadales bacterium]|nr:SPW repeat protein [Gemmatimonadales bacterium]